MHEILVSPTAASDVVPGAHPDVGGEILPKKQWKTTLSVLVSDLPTGIEVLDIKQL